MSAQETEIYKLCSEETNHVGICFIYTENHCIEREGGREKEGGREGERKREGGRKRKRER